MQTSNILTSIQTKRAKINADRERALSWFDANPLKAPMLSSTAFELRELDRVESAYLTQLQREEAVSAYASLPWYKKLFTSQP